jgi:transcriptional antiterminator NusG
MSSGLNWYVLRAVSGQEKKIKTYIENEITRQKLGEYVPQILIPSEKVFELRNGKKRVREKNFFPGYIIISADLSQGEVFHIITSIPGVIGFLGSSEGTSKVPVPLRQAEVNRILGKVDEAAEEIAAPIVSFYTGETVKIVDGPFSSFVGVVEEISEERKKLKVVVKIFGRSQPVELSYAQVEKDS